jgi:ribonuclease E
MKKVMLINAVDPELSRMAIVENGKLIEFNIQMKAKEPITGNLYKGIVLKVERGLQAAFVDYGARKHGFLPLHDVSPEYFAKPKEEGEKETEHHPRPSLKAGQEVIVQVLREEKDHKGAMLTTLVSLPGRYLVLMPNRQSTGISRKIDDEKDRKNLISIMDQIIGEDKFGFIVRTAGINRTKQELSRDYDVLSRLWKDIVEKTASISAPSLIYQESDIGIKSLRDYFTPDISEILVDDMDTYRKMRAYCKTVAPRHIKMIKLYTEKAPLFDRYNLESQIDSIYRERVELKSGGSIVINPTEAMITIDVNSGRGSDRRDAEETAYRNNLEAAEEIARQLRLRDLGGLIVIDFIDMRDRKHIAEVEKNFKKALSLDRSRIQMSRISKFGMLEISRQKKKSTIQEISHTICPYCKGSGIRPTLEYAALGMFRKIKSKAVQGSYSRVNVTLANDVSDYLLNQKRTELAYLEKTYDVAIHISGNPDMLREESKFEFIEAERDIEPVLEPAPAVQGPVVTQDSAKETASEPLKTAKKESRRRRPRYRKRRPSQKIQEQSPEEATAAPETAVEAEQDHHAATETEPGNNQEKEKGGLLNRITSILKI